MTKDDIFITDSFHPTWIENVGGDYLPPASPEVTSETRQMAEAAGLAAEPFKFWIPFLGGRGMILEPKGGEKGLCELSPARTITLLALIKAFFRVEVIRHGMVWPLAGFADAQWLSKEIECLTEDTRLLFNPSNADVRVAIRRLKDTLEKGLGRADLIEGRVARGYRFRVWPSLITVIVCNETVT